jgi:uncharacterized membrane protein HdeD (DUF308 family)
MQIQWNFGNLGAIWVAPAFLGVALILFGVLILAFPLLLRLIVAAVLIMAGCSLLGLAWHMRGRVTYRQMDDRCPGPEDV